MPQNYAPEFKRRLSVSMKRKDALTKVSQQNMVYPKLPSLRGVNNSVKNALPSHDGINKPRIKSRLR